MPQQHTVQEGECVSSIAFSQGFFPATVWNAPENADLRKLRGSLYVLQPGDVVTIPDKRTKSHDSAIDAFHRFRLKGVPEKLRVTFLIGGQPRANENYQIEIDGRPVGGGKTSGSGELAIGIVPNAAQARITIAGQVFTLLLGNLAPVAEPRGLQMRLQNLGYYAGPIDGQMSDETEEALAAFQIDQGLEPSADPDDSTRAALVKAYGA